MWCLVPAPRKGQVLVRVAATSVNAADLTFRSGALRPLTGRKFPRGTVFDFAGTVSSTAEDVTPWSVGDPVWGSSTASGGGVGTAATQLAIAMGALVTALPYWLQEIDRAHHVMPLADRSASTSWRSADEVDALYPPVAGRSAACRCSGGAG